MLKHRVFSGSSLSLKELEMTGNTASVTRLDKENRVPVKTRRHPTDSLPATPLKMNRVTQVKQHHNVAASSDKERVGGKRRRFISLGSGTSKSSTGAVNVDGRERRIGAPRIREKSRRIRSMSSAAIAGLYSGLVGTHGLSCRSLSANLDARKHAAGGNMTKQQAEALVQAYVDNSRIPGRSANFTSPSADKNRKRRSSTGRGVTFRPGDTVHLITPSCPSRRRRSASLNEGLRFRNGADSVRHQNNSTFTMTQNMDQLKAPEVYTVKMTQFSSKNKAETWSINMRTLNPERSSSSQQQLQNAPASSNRMSSLHKMPFSNLTNAQQQFSSYNLNTYL